MMCATYDRVAQGSRFYAAGYPFIELALGLAYITGSFPALSDAVTVIIMGAGSVGVFQEIKKRRGTHCACLGNIIKLPLSTVSLIEDVGMGAMAAIMFVLR